jgi:hypothetical protein
MLAPAANGFDRGGVSTPNFLTPVPQLSAILGRNLPSASWVESETGRVLADRLRRLGRWAWVLSEEERREIEAIIDCPVAWCLFWTSSPGAEMGSLDPSLGAASTAGPSSVHNPVSRLESSKSGGLRRSSRQVQSGPRGAAPPPPPSHLEALVPPVMTNISSEYTPSLLGGSCTRSRLRFRVRCELATEASRLLTAINAGRDCAESVCAELAVPSVLESKPSLAPNSPSPADDAAAPLPGAGQDAPESSVAAPDFEAINICDRVYSMEEEYWYAKRLASGEVEPSFAPRLAARLLSAPVEVYCLAAPPASSQQPNPLVARPNLVDQAMADLEAANAALASARAEQADLLEHASHSGVSTLPALSGSFAPAPKSAPYAAANGVGGTAVFSAPVRGSRRSNRQSDEVLRNADPHTLQLDAVLQSLRSYRPFSEPFLTRVRKSEAPDYYEVVKRPMDLGTMASKLRDGFYTRRALFVSDLELIFSNCRFYNPDETSAIREYCDELAKRATLLLAEVQEFDLTVPPLSQSAAASAQSLQQLQLQQFLPPQASHPTDDSKSYPQLQQLQLQQQQRRRRLQHLEQNGNKMVTEEEDIGMAQPPMPMTDALQPELRQRQQHPFREEADSRGDGMLDNGKRLPQQNLGNQMQLEDESACASSVARHKVDCNDVGSFGHMVLPIRQSTASLVASSGGDFPRSTFSSVWAAGTVAAASADSDPLTPAEISSFAVVPEVSLGQFQRMVRANLENECDGYILGEEGARDMLYRHLVLPSRRLVLDDRARADNVGMGISAHRAVTRSALGMRIFAEEAATFSDNFMPELSKPGYGFPLSSVCCDSPDTLTTQGAESAAAAESESGSDSEDSDFENLIRNGELVFPSAGGGVDSDEDDLYISSRLDRPARRPSRVQVPKRFRDYVRERRCNFVRRNVKRLMRVRVLRHRIMLRSCDGGGKSDHLLQAPSILSSFKSELARPVRCAADASALLAKSCTVLLAHGGFEACTGSALEIISDAAARYIERLARAMALALERRRHLVMNDVLLEGLKAVRLPGVAPLLQYVEEDVIAFGVRAAAARESALRGLAFEAAARGLVWRTGSALVRSSCAASACAGGRVGWLHSASEPRWRVGSARPRVRRDCGDRGCSDGTGRGGLGSGGRGIILVDAWLGRFVGAWDTVPW